MVSEPISDHPFVAAWHVVLFQRYEWTVRVGGMLSLNFRLFELGEM